jgi:hypothetical protein
MDHLAKKILIAMEIKSRPSGGRGKGVEDARQSAQPLRVICGISSTDAGAGPQPELFGASLADDDRAGMSEGFGAVRSFAHRAGS